MKRPLKVEDWVCLAVLLALLALVGLYQKDPFFCATAAGTVLSAFAAVVRRNCVANSCCWGFYSRFR